MPQLQCEEYGALVESHRVAYNTAVHTTSIHGEHDFESVMAHWKAASIKLECGIHQLRCESCLSRLHAENRSGA